MARSTQVSQKSAARHSPYSQPLQRPPRSTASPPPASSARPTRSSVVLSQPLPLAYSDSEAEEPASEDDSAASEADVVTQLDSLSRLQGYSSGSDEADGGDGTSSINDADGAGALSDVDAGSDIAVTSDTSAHPMSEDEADLLASLARAAEAASQADADPDSVRPSKKGKQKAVEGEDEVKDFFATLLDGVRRSDLRKEFKDFIRYDQRNTINTPRRQLKNFTQDKSKSFTKLFELYPLTARAAPHNDDVLNAFESFLAELMDCFDHPHEIRGWNPFSALADFVNAGALFRTPEVLKSCARLTLGADWGLLSEEDRQRIGGNIMASVYRLHLERMVAINSLLTRWSDKFRRDSTCQTCNTDSWEIFLLTVPLSMMKQGTRYIDVETASDTSSEGSDGRGEHGMDVDSTRSDDDGELDDHQRQDSDSEGDADSQLEQPLEHQHAIIDDTQEPVRSLHRNYGPNAYVLRIVDIGQLGCGEFKRAAMKVCPRCGYRFDGKLPERSTLFYRDLERAFSVAREQIAKLSEDIHLPAQV
ncbi:hypothetical protein PSEUBRA_000890 [Kalmanozyma brasiliensis GHG001]|uniref:uncharacterized protein n=1 Tax=Kalmanozyma brasiliensis (strain GHG001) TaxID=1365824 RepID=UPI001CEA862F|nr:uncharacterized protein PSEUBRA_000890 [Kalmanozyma brasiliensis GHG001]KAF6766860.1 hypothetical protein PSEUBRA_000890 [Kalmanozyma brasiliensis GHG001]